MLPQLELHVAVCSFFISLVHLPCFPQKKESDSLVQSAERSTVKNQGKKEGVHWWSVISLDSYILLNTFEESRIKLDFFSKL